MADDRTARAPSRIDRIIDGAFLLTMPALAWLAVFGHRGAAVVVCLSAMAIAFRPQIWREGLPLLAPSLIMRATLSRAAAAMLAFTLWIAFTGLWSPTNGAAKLALGIAVFTLSGGALVYEASTAAPGRTRRLVILFSLAVLGASAVLLFEGVTGGLLRAIVPPEDQSPHRWRDMTALARGVSLIAPLVFPAAAMLWLLTRSPFIAAAPILAALVAAMQFTVTANVVALLAGLAAGAGALWRPRAALIAMGALFLVSLFAAPLFAITPAEAVISAETPILPPSWTQRLNLWKAAADRLGEDGRFLWGYGADYTRAWFEEGALIKVPGSPIPLPEAPTHPHNVFLQIWLELGLIGVLTIAAAIGFGLCRLAAVPPRRIAFAAIAAASAATYISFMLEASLWQAWRLAVIALAAFGGALSYSFNRTKRN